MGSSGTRRGTGLLAAQEQSLRTLQLGRSLHFLRLRSKPARLRVLKQRRRVHFLRQRLQLPHLRRL